MDKDILFLQKYFNLLQKDDTLITDEDYRVCNEINEKIKEWITVKGNHIPIREGQTREQAIESFIEDKSTGGYSKINGRYKSNRNIAAQLQGKDTLSGLSKKLKIPAKELEGLYSDEWHHTGKDYNKEAFYYSEAFIDLQKNNKISEKTIEKYDLNKYQIDGITESWEKLIKKLGGSKAEDILKPFFEKYKNDPRLLEDLKNATKKGDKKDSLATESIRRMLEAYRNGEEPLERLSTTIDFFSKEAREKRRNKNKAVSNSSMDEGNILSRGYNQIYASLIV